MTGLILPLASSNTQGSAETEQVASIEQFHQNIFAFYTLKWRQNILWVSPQANQANLAAVPVQQLVDRLKQSPVRCVCVDAALGEAHLKTWSEACAQSGKQLHLRSPKGLASTPQGWTAKRFFQHSFRWLRRPLPKVIAALAR